jgi:hypothetical protein
MSNVALGSDGKKHYANDFSDSCRGEYFCPNDRCEVKLYLKKLGIVAKASGKIAPYFSAFPNSPHF